MPLHSLPYGASHDLARWRLDLLEFPFADLFREEADSVLAGYAIVGKELEDGDARYRGLEAPTCVLVDGDGGGLQIDWCNCGYNGGGPNSSRSLLRGLGFDDEATRFILTHEIVRLERGVPEPIVASQSPFTREWNGPQPVLRVIDGRHTLLLRREHGINDEVFWRCWQEWAGAWTPAPIEVRVWLGAASFATAPSGWRYSFRTELADLLVLDESGRQFAALTPASRGRELPVPVAEFLAAAGLRPPSEERVRGTRRQTNEDGEIVLRLT